MLLIDVSERRAAHLFVVVALALQAAVLWPQSSAVAAPSGRFVGYVTCVTGRINVALNVQDEGGGWLTASFASADAAKDRSDVGTSARLAGWFDQETSLFKLDWVRAGPRSYTYPMDNPIQLSFVGTYRQDDQLLDGLTLAGPCATFVAGREGRPIRPSAPELPRQGSNDLREYNRVLQSWFDRVEQTHRLRAEALPRVPARAGEQQRESLRCGPYFIYYDKEFLGRHRALEQLFFTRAGARRWPPYGFTVSRTPPDAVTEWIDEVETVSYAIGPRIYNRHSMARRIRRNTVTPAPAFHGTLHSPMVLKQSIKCGGGETYRW